MAHLRERHAKEAFETLKRLSPLVGVFGHRQAGKTTFLEQVCKSYQSFDDRDALSASRENPADFLNSLGAKPAGIDECQLSPDLFPALKEFVRKNKRPGQIVLSGSVKFYSRQAVRESLTGRIVNIDMLPLVLTELEKQGRAKLALKLIQKETYSGDIEISLPTKLLHRTGKAMDSYYENGGLPGVCFLRNDRIRTERIREQLILILDRDIRLVYPTSLSYSQIFDFAAELSRQEGEPIHPTQLRKSTGISETTQKKLIHAFEAVFLIRVLSVEGDRRGSCVYFEDQAEHRSLQGSGLDPLRAFEGLVYRNLRATFNYEIGLDYRVFQFRVRPDVRIPFAFQTKQGCLAILPTLEKSGPSRRDLRIAHRFLQRYSPATVLIVTSGVAATRVLEPRILQIPAERLLFEEG